MTPLEFTLVTFAIAAGAGLLGSLVGLGGGVIVVPALTLLLGIDIRYAIGASIIAVIATSSGAAASYVERGLTNLRVAMFLELATTSGAISGAFLTGLVSGRWLFVIFGGVLGASGLVMVGRVRGPTAARATPGDALASRLRLGGAYFDAALGREVTYDVARPKLGLLLMYVAGALSGLLGIGSGVLKVPAMDLAMRMPIKASSATSNFMIGVTAAASAGVYFGRGDIDPFVAAPVAAGVVLGAAIGARLLDHVHGRVVRVLFITVLLGISAQMIHRGLS